MSEEKNTSNENQASAKQMPSEQVKKSQPLLWLIVAAIGIYLAVQSLGVSFVLNILIVALGIGLVIGVHEFGHFSLAKLTGMKVEAFSLGFPPALFCFKRTEKGYRIRFLPTLIRKGRAETAEGAKPEEGGAEIYFGGPKKEGETEYKIGLIPFGGFVKILGQEDVGAAKSTNDPRAYSNKPAWARALVLVAGVSFNLIAAILISVAVFRIGIKFIPPVVGEIVPGSAAAKAGLESGDEIIEIAGKSFNIDFSDIAMISGFSEKGQIISVKARSKDGTINETELIAEDGDLESKIYAPFGIDEPRTLKIGRYDKGSENKALYEATGLKPGDVIRSIDGEPVNTYGQMNRQIEDIFGPEVTVGIERSKASGVGDVNKIFFKTKLPLSLGVSLRTKEAGDNIGNVYSMVPRIKVTGLLFGILLDANWVRPGDVILKVADIAEPSFKELTETTGKYDDKFMPIEVLRTDANGVERKVTAVVRPRYNPDMEKVAIGVALAADLSRPAVARMIPFGDKEEGLGIPRGSQILLINGEKMSSFYDIARTMARNANKEVKIEWQEPEGQRGITVITEEEWKYFGIARPVISRDIPFELMSRLYKAESPLQAVKMGYGKTITFIEQQYLTLKAVAQRKVGPKGLSGPVGIIRISYKLVKEKQFVYYAYLIGVFVNAALAALNLLPILPLDGGALFFLLIEKIKGSPVSEKFQASVATAGVVFVILVSIYITVNDIMR